MHNEENEQLTILEEKDTYDQPVTCLGMTFKNDDERRAYFMEELRKKLPELRKIEGSPIGEDEDILALSDPPYYTACPNPWIYEIVKEWRKHNKEEDNYHREPFASNVLEGKNDPVYNVHGYHTKVPYKAIMRYILHYTNPNDIIYDGFSGTGMTGVAAERCGIKEEIEELGYEVIDDNIISDGKIISKLGKRRVILNDLSPSAYLISYNLNNMTNKKEFLEEVNNVLEKVKEECSWMYKTEHASNIDGNINYCIYSDVFICPNCSEEIIYWDVAVSIEEKKIYSNFNCKFCNTYLKKDQLERAWEYKFDPALGKIVKIAKQVIVNINYSLGNKRFEKKPDEKDLNIIRKIEELDFLDWYPIERMPEGDESRRNDRMGITHVHHFFTKRNLITLASFYKYARKSKYFSNLIFIFQAAVLRSSKTNRFRFGGTGGLSGTLYIPSLIFERNVISLLEKKLDDFKKVLINNKSEINAVVFVQSTTEGINLKENSIDYIFTDPPFGSNLMYSELNFLWEAWLKLITNNKNEAIINNTQGKNVQLYQDLMEKSFKQYYRLLKPGRWITVEFSNSKASVWNALQEALQRAGFIIANVSALDKKQGSFKAVTTTTAVKQDLVISAYKPSETMKNAFNNKLNIIDSVWTFVSEHLKQLPIFIGVKGNAQVIVERTPRVLFDRMVAYFVQNGLQVPISSAEFQEGVAQRFPVRDGMVFLECQVAEYDKKRILAKEFAQLSIFVSDETSAIEWIRQQLMKKPQTRQELHPNFMKEIQHISKHELLPELDDLLYQNFLLYDGEGPVPDQIMSYIRKNYKDLRTCENLDPRVIEKAKNRWYIPDPNKQADLEKLREKSLLREFDSYVEEIKKSKKKLKQFRTEAIRTGFKKAWAEKDYQKIVFVGERLPENILQEDDKLLMYFDNAQIRLGL